MQIRNFSIIAHIDHGKSTLSDRLLMRAGAITEREFKDQILDDMDLERERGITIKASAVTVFIRTTARTTCSTSSTRPATSTSTTKSARPCRPAKARILVVDATQGVQAQTVANAYAAIERDWRSSP